MPRKESHDVKMKRADQTKTTLGANPGETRSERAEGAGANSDRSDLHPGATTRDEEAAMTTQAA